MTMARSAGSDSAIFWATVVLPLPVPPAIPMRRGLVAVLVAGVIALCRHGSDIVVARLAFEEDYGNYFVLSLSLPHDVRDCRNLAAGARATPDPTSPAGGDEPLPRARHRHRRPLGCERRRGGRLGREPRLSR